MMYWIVFALFSTAETVTDMFLSWFPFYFELKIAFVVWLLSPYTKGSSVLYRKFVHPTLSNKEKEIDEYITQAKDRSYQTTMRFWKRGLNIAATVAVSAAAKGQGVLSEKLRSFSLQDLTLIQNEEELLDGVDETHAAATLPRAKTRTARAPPITADSESQLSSRPDADQSDSRTEQSEEDAADKMIKRAPSVRAAKKPAAAKTEVTKTVKKQPKKKSTATSNTAETPP
ncbi:receptor expression-enhancing protein 2 isoform X2 [Trichomycterus rosablanca]